MYPGQIERPYNHLFLERIAGIEKEKNDAHYLGRTGDLRIQYQADYECDALPLGQAGVKLSCFLLDTSCLASLSISLHTAGPVQQCQHWPLGLDLGTYIGTRRFDNFGIFVGCSSAAVYMDTYIKLQLRMWLYGLLGRRTAKGAWGYINQQTTEVMPLIGFQGQ